MTHPQRPKWKHDCDRCRFLGYTLVGCRVTDLYVCVPVLTPDDVTLIARYGDDSADYLSMNSIYVSPHGHSELFVAEQLWLRSQRSG